MYYVLGQIFKLEKFLSYPEVYHWTVNVAVTPQMTSC